MRTFFSKRKVVVVLIAALLLALGSGAVYAASLRNYQCSNCYTLVKSQSAPRNENCPRARFHTWHDLGEVGAVNYQCGKCGLLVQSKYAPGNFNCQAGGFHQWGRL